MIRRIVKSQDNNFDPQGAFLLLLTNKHALEKDNNINNCNNNYILVYILIPSADSIQKGAHLLYIVHWTTIATKHHSASN